MSVQRVPTRKGYHAVGAGWFDNGQLRYVIWEKDRKRSDQVEPEPSRPEGQRQSLLL